VIGLPPPDASVAAVNPIDAAVIARAAHDYSCLAGDGLRHRVAVIERAVAAHTERLGHPLSDLERELVRLAAAAMETGSAMFNATWPGPSQQRGSM
jgi:hypothetical protein